MHATNWTSGIILALLCFALQVSTFDLTAHRTYNCFRNTAKFVCFNVGYNYCCRRPLQNDRTRFVGFLSMSQSSSQGPDIIVIHKARSGEACGGTAVGSNTYGCADADTGIGMGGMVHRCTGDCARSAPECLGSVDADAVFYNNKAYKSYPEDLRLGQLVERMMEDEELDENELQELEAIRLPEHDIADDEDEAEAETARSIEPQKKA